MVLCAGRVKHRLAQDVKDQLTRSGCKILGVVLNQVSRKNNGGTYYGTKYSQEYYADSAAPQSQPTPQQPTPQQPVPQRRPAPERGEVRRPMPQAQARTNHNPEQK